jgi:hypothetical protein
LRHIVTENQDASEFKVTDTKKIENALHYYSKKH